MTGETHHRARYSDDDVELARALSDEGLSTGEIARKFEAPYHTVRDWVRYRTRTGALSYRQNMRRANA